MNFKQIMHDMRRLFALALALAMVLTLAPVLGFGMEVAKAAGETIDQKFLAKSGDFNHFTYAYDDGKGATAFEIGLIVNKITASNTETGEYTFELFTNEEGVSFASGTNASISDATGATLCSIVIADPTKITAKGFGTKITISKGDATKAVTIYPTAMYKTTVTGNGKVVIDDTKVTGAKQRTTTVTSASQSYVCVGQVDSKDNSTASITSIHLIPDTGWKITSFTINGTDKLSDDSFDSDANTYSFVALSDVYLVEATYEIDEEALGEVILTKTNGFEVNNIVAENSADGAVSTLTVALKTDTPLAAGSEIVPNDDHRGNVLAWYQNAKFKGAEDSFELLNSDSSVKVISSDTFYGRFGLAGIDLSAAYKLASPTSDGELPASVWVYHENPMLSMYSDDGRITSNTDASDVVIWNKSQRATPTNASITSYTLVPSNDIFADSADGKIIYSVYGDSSYLASKPSSDKLLFSLVLDCNGVEYSAASNITEELKLEGGGDASDNGQVLIDKLASATDALKAAGQGGDEGAAENAQTEIIIQASTEAEITLPEALEIPENFTLVLATNTNMTIDPDTATMTVAANAELKIEDAATLTVASSTNANAQLPARRAWNPNLTSFNVSSLGATVSDNQVGLFVNGNITVSGTGVLEVQQNAYVKLANTVTITGQSASNFKIDGTIINQAGDGIIALEGYTFTGADLSTNNNNNNNNNTDSGSYTPPAGGSTTPVSPIKSTGAMVSVNGAVLSAAVDNPENYTFQWQMYSNGRWLSIAGATGAEYKLTSLTSNTEYRVKVIATNKNGSKTEKELTFKTDNWQVIKSGSLKLRNSASSASPLLATLMHGARITVLSTEGFWAKVKTTVNGKEITGYVAKSYVEALPKVEYVQSNTINVRYAASLTSGTYTTLKKGDAVRVIGRIGAFVEIDINGTSYFVGHSANGKLLIK